MRVLIAEDDPLGGVLLERAVAREGHQVELFHDGLSALKRAQGELPFDAALVDLVMPGLDGLELMKALRVLPAPPILIVTTALTSSESRTRALEAGADDYITKPYDAERVMQVLQRAFSRRHQTAGPSRLLSLPTAPGASASFPCVALGAGSGGPTVLRQLLARVGAVGAAMVIVQQAPDYILDTLVKMLQSSSAMPVALAREGDPLKPGVVLLAPADRHTTVGPGLTVHLSDEPPENFLRPSVDPLLRSVGKLFGSRALAVILSGMGCDGAQGCTALSSAGGTVLVQHPNEAVTPSMPASVLGMGMGRALTLAELAEAIVEFARIEH